MYMNECIFEYIYRRQKKSCLLNMNEWRSTERLDWMGGSIKGIKSYNKDLRYILFDI